MKPVKLWLNSMTSLTKTQMTPNDTVGNVRITLQGSEWFHFYNSLQSTAGDPPGVAVLSANNPLTKVFLNTWGGVNNMDPGWHFAK